MRKMWMTVSLAFLTGCGGAQPRSAQEAEPSGARERSAATQQPGGVQVGTADGSRTEGPPYPEDYDYEPVWFGRRIGGPERGPALDRASAEARHSRGASQGIVEFTGKACRGIPPGARRACPILSALRAVEPAPNGFLVHFEPWVEPTKLVRLMRCHMAYGRATGYQDMPFCPLYVRGLELERRDGAVFFGIEASQREELRRRFESHVEEGSGE